MKSRANRTTSSYVNTYNNQYTASIAIIWHSHFTSVFDFTENLSTIRSSPYLNLRVCIILTKSSTFLVYKQTTSTRYARQHTRQARAHLTCNYIFYFLDVIANFVCQRCNHINNKSAHHLWFVPPQPFICCQILQLYIMIMSEFHICYWKSINSVASVL